MRNSSSDNRNSMFRYHIRDIIDIERAKIVISKLTYSTENLVNCLLDEATQDIVIQVNENCIIDDLISLIDKLINDTKNTRVIHHKIIKDNTIKNDINILLESNFHFNNFICKNEAIELYDIFDLLFMEIANGRHALQRQYTSLIAVETMKKCSYIKNFPQNVFFVSELPHDLQVLDQQQGIDNYEELVRLSTYMLSPAICFHCYEEYQEQQLEKPLVLTARGNCFRHEASWRIGNYRLNEFSMREIFYLGDAFFVENLRTSLMEDVWSLFTHLGFNGKIETANDPFYFSQDAMKGQYQLIANMKYELIVHLRNGEAFALGSFNNMKDTLCKQFKISQAQGIPAHSGCTGFGIDRWVYAVLVEFGSDSSKWPAKIKEKMRS